MEKEPHAEDASAAAQSISRRPSRVSATGSVKGTLSKQWGKCWISSLDGKSISSTDISHHGGLSWGSLFGGPCSGSLLHFIWAMGGSSCFWREVNARS